MGLLEKYTLEELAEKLNLETLSDSEYKALRKWITKGSDKEKLAQLLKLHWDKTTEFNDEVNEQKLNEIHTQLRSQIRPVNKAKTPHSRFYNWIRLVQKTAAILFLPLLGLSLYLFVNKSVEEGTQVPQGVLQTVEVSPGVRSNFFLPDSTEVWLNADSKLQFSTNMINEKERRLKLTGQGYFKVTHDAAHPFIVETEMVSVKVLGTSFDISAYANDPFIRTTLDEGSVEVLGHEGNKLLTLAPGQQSYLNIDKRKMWAKKVKTSDFTSWKEGKLVFRNTPVLEVRNQLERWYGYEIILSDKIMKSEFTYTGTIKNETITDVLKMIQLTTPIKYTIEDRKITVW